MILYFPNYWSRMAISHKYEINWWDLNELNNFFILKYPENRELVDEALRLAPAYLQRLINKNKVEIFDDGLGKFRAVKDLSELLEHLLSYEYLLYFYERSNLGIISKIITKQGLKNEKPSVLYKDFTFAIAEFLETGRSTRLRELGAEEDKIKQMGRSVGSLQEKIRKPLISCLKAIKKPERYQSILKYLRTEIPLAMYYRKTRYISLAILSLKRESEIYNKMGITFERKRSDIDKDLIVHSPIGVEASGIYGRWRYKNNGIPCYVLKLLSEISGFGLNEIKPIAWTMAGSKMIKSPKFPIEFNINFGRLLGRLFAKGAKVDQRQLKSGEVVGDLRYYGDTEEIRRSIMNELFYTTIGERELTWVKKKGEDEMFGIKLDKTTEQRYYANLPKQLTELLEAFFGEPLSKYLTDSFEKHILPMKFLKRCNKWVRMATIQGFFDERASISRSGLSFFCSNNDKLLEQIVELCSHKPLDYKFTSDKPLIHCKSGSKYKLLGGEYRIKFLKEIGFTIPHKIDRGIESFGIDSRKSKLNIKLPLKSVEKYYEESI